MSLTQSMKSLFKNLRKLLSVLACFVREYLHPQMFNQDSKNYEEALSLPQKQ